MDSVQTHIAPLVCQYFKPKFDIDLDPRQITINETREDFEGEYSLVVFPLVKGTGLKPPELAEELGEMLRSNSPIVASYNVVKGFLNLVFTSDFWIEELLSQDENGIQVPKSGSGLILLEYGSPNSNKPLHLGHVRNLLLGRSVGRILEAVGFDIHFTQIVNDRGIAICKSMIAWQKYFSGQSPNNTGKKPDHFVGDTYVRYGEELEREYTSWQKTQEAQSIYESNKKKDEDASTFFKSYKHDYVNRQSELGRETKDMLLAWEDNDQSTRALWKQMNDWFMDGFMQTCDRMDVTFDSMQFESDTYLLGKDIINRGLKEGIFYRKEDRSVWVDLTEDGYDEKLVLRSDGTSVYITQDLGTARLRYEKYGMDGMIYTVANEQDYHFNVLFEILKKLGEPYADRLYHLSYGMVDLPTGRMKTREGTVVDADDLIDEIHDQVSKNNEERGELQMLPVDEKNKIIEQITMASLKYYMLRVEAKKRMVFNPEESVDLQGQTGPYIQNAYVRIRSIMRKLKNDIPKFPTNYKDINVEEKKLIMNIISLGGEVSTAAKKYDPSVMASYAYQLAKNFHKFYHDHSILRAENEDAAGFRYKLAEVVAHRLKYAMNLLGIEMVERM